MNNILPIELQTNILTTCSEYSPVLKSTCRLWNNIIFDVKTEDDRRKTLGLKPKLSQILSVDQLIKLGHTELIKYIGNDNFDNKRINELLICAAECGHIETMKLLKKWGATDYSLALSYATGRGHIKAMMLLKKWGGMLSCQIAFNNAARRGHIDVMKLLNAWGATDYDYALACAAEGGQIGAMILLKEWGATDYNWALRCTVYESQLDAMRLLRKWGATRNYNELLSISIIYDQLEAMKLLKEWGAIRCLDYESWFSRY